MAEKSNAQRFINAYNEIDYALRIKYNLKQSMNFSDIIRRSSAFDGVVRKFEDKLIDFGRLRNSIVHRSNEEFIIAEPHTDVVEEFERLAKIICSPPRVIDTFCKRPVTSVKFDLSIKDVIQIISQTGFSNIPVYKDEEIIGIANGQRIINSIGSIIAKGKDVSQYIEHTTIDKILKIEGEIPYYIVEPQSVTIERALNLFFTNRKLLVILITKTGQLKEMPIGIITNSDIMDMNKILEDY